MRVLISQLLLIFLLGLLVAMIGLIMQANDPVNSGMYKAVAIISTCLLLRVASNKTSRS